jgi:GrpB-like predicted nucleotidyltransferase (UPF0157 family)
MKTEHVVVVPYDKRWAVEFEKIKRDLSRALEETVIGVEHVGSTSVEGLWAKPIIDIDVIIPDYNCFPDVVNRLAAIGYQHEGNLGIEGREAFRYQDKPDFMTHHLYVCPQNSPELKRHIAFRNFLGTHPKDVETYSEVKRQGARLFPNDIDQYCSYKSACIEEIYKRMDYEFS